ncbi:MAG: hypothetical protein D6778_04475 [Nitrospirae bacterium]|nr:MAG: hypothetical protein D6778_04475 [Nitrospirota bacterium]
MKRTAIAIILFITILFAYTPPAKAVTLEYPYLYKDPRIMAMGGANVAVGGYAASMFHNPAGVGTIPEEYGFEIDLIGLTGSVSKDGKDFVDDLNDAFDTGDLNNNGNTADDQTKAVLDVLKKYRGKTLHYGLNSLLSISRRFGPLGVSIAALGSLNIDAQVHQGFSSQGIVSLNGSFTYGPVAGLSYAFMDEKLIVGASAKVMHRESVVHDFTAREIVENQTDLENYFTDELLKKGDAFGLDLGAIYRLPEILGFSPSVGVSYLNIGDLDFGEAGKVPGTVNIGAALEARRDAFFFDRIVLALDLVDITKNYEQDSDLGKRLRAGAELRVWGGGLTDMILRAGSYQGYWTAGVEFRLAMVRLVASSYAEEMGGYSGQDENRRYMLSLYINF